MAHVTGHEAADIILAVGEVLALFGAAPVTAIAVAAKPVARLVEAIVNVTRKRDTDDFDNSGDGGIL